MIHVYRVEKEEFLGLMLCPELESESVTSPDWCWGLTVNLAILLVLHGQFLSLGLLG